MRILEGHAEDRRRPELGGAILASAPRMGVMAHYDASLNDVGGLRYLLSAEFRMGYNAAIDDQGIAHEIIDLGKRAPHAGYSRSSDPARLPYPDDQANSAFYGIALLATAGDLVTLPQLGTFIRITARIFEHHGWPLQEAWRLTDHYTEACYPVGHPKAGQRGRKVDVIGWDPTLPDTPGNRHREKPVMDMAYLRRWLETAR